MMKDGIKYKQGNIVLIPFPYTDFSTAKQRPALIISNEKMNKFEDIICCLVTSNPSKETVLIKKEDFESGKLPFKSWIKPYRIFTVHRGIIRKRLCTVKGVFSNKILKEIMSYLEKG